MNKQNVRQERDYQIQLQAIVDCVKFFCRQGLTFRGHDESESSFNEGNFREFLRFLEDHNEEIDKVIFDKALQNLNLIAPTIQKNIVNACVEETTKDIITELGDELFSILIDEARDVSTKEYVHFVRNIVLKFQILRKSTFDNPRYQTGATNLHYYRVDLFNMVIDMQLKELNDRFNETNIQLLICMSCLDTRNFFSAFDIEKLVKSAQFYSSDFNQFKLLVLNSKLENYILDVQDNRAFLEVSIIFELSEKMVKTNRHNVHPLVYKLVKLGLILPVATASVERAFSTINIMKFSMRSRMRDQWMNDCLITFNENDLFKKVSNERIMERFQNMKARREILI